MTGQSIDLETPKPAQRRNKYICMPHDSEIKQSNKSFQLDICNVINNADSNFKAIPNDNKMCNYLKSGVIGATYLLISRKSRQGEQLSWHCLLTWLAK